MNAREINAKLDELQERRSGLSREAHEIHDGSADRVLNPGETERFSRLTRGIEKIDDQRRELIGQLAALPGHAVSGDGATGAPEFTGEPAGRSRSRSAAFHASRDVVSSSEAVNLDAASTRDAALRLLEQRGKHLEPRSVDKVESLLRSEITEQDPNVSGDYIARRMLITETRDYQSAFGQILAAGMRGRAPVLTAAEADAIRAFERFEARAMSEGTGSAGGVGVPVMIDPTIILTGQQSGDYEDILRIARVETITTSAWKGVSSAGVSWSFDTEGAAASDDSPTLAQPEVSVHMARGWIPYSIEVGQDYPGFAEEMATLLSEGYLELASEKVTVGSGSGEPRGVVTALDANTNVEVVLQTAGAMPAAEIYDLWDALPKRARRRATWMSAQSVQNRVRQLGAATSGTADPNFTVDLSSEMIQRLFGKQYKINDWMDDFSATTGTENLLVVGDFSRFLVAQRAGMSIEPVPHLFDVTNNRPTGQRGFFAWARIGADSLDDTAFRLLQNKAS